MRPRTYVLLAATALSLAGLLAAGRVARAQAGAKPIDFDRQIRPIFADNCFTCHGPDEKNRMAGLRLDIEEGWLADRPGRGPALVPGAAQKSKLFHRITAEKEDERMPAAMSGKPRLKPEQIELIRKWIDEGAHWNRHWAFVAPRRPAIPAVRNRAWVRNPIDAFILARLDREGLKPSPEADRATLIRRVSLDLTGLPPTPAEVDAFLNDKAPDAYEKLVDRLLASPHYGERMAMPWLDLARYADTHGYHIDSHREMWHWRDWVIDAFNRNLPFDKFAVWQIAGDLLPNATREQRLATGFNRNHMINFEGGAIPDEYQTEYVVDRVETTSGAFLGLTMGCARCHDHKFDPIKQKDFYSFFAFFNSISEKGLDGRAGNAEPLLRLDRPMDEVRLNDLDRAIRADEQELSDKKVQPVQTPWEKTLAAKLPESSHEGLAAHYEFDGSLSDVSGHYRHARLTNGEMGYGDGPVNRAAAFNGETGVEYTSAVTLDSGKPFSIAAWVRSNGQQEMTILQKLDVKAARGFQLLFGQSVPLPVLKRTAHLEIRLARHFPDNALEVRTREPLVVGGDNVNSWYHLAINYDGSGQAAGVRLFVNGKPRELEVLRDRLSGAMTNDAPLSTGEKSDADSYKGQLDDLRVYGRQLAAAEIEQLALYAPLRAAAWSNIPPRQRSPVANRLLREYFLSHDAPEHLRTMYAELLRLRAERDRLVQSIPTSMVMSEMEKPRETFILARGDYRNKTVKVQPDVPAALPPLPAGAPRNRLALARWIVDPANPLTARVTVNRYWQMYFGTGLVKTSEDFGTRGEAPSHPELLDWLATEFVRTGWDVKAIQRLIVTSSTYRQSSKTTKMLVEKDPENRLLAHGPRFRLPAELVRDNALAAAGLLNQRVGGPAAFPYQPPGLWEEISFGDVYSSQVFRQSHGDDLYRRSMYTFWKRTSGPPELISFDAPDREKCKARRERTNTPLQALVLMNDPTYVEAAKALAARMVDTGRSPADRVREGFRLATARVPAPREEHVLEELARQETEHYRRAPDAAEKLLRVGESKPDAKVDRAELAAWTTVASVILQLDETITKE